MAKTVEELVKAARKAEINGAERFGIVTSGNSLDSEELNTICETVREISTTGKIKPCASLGALSQESLEALRDSGLTRYHHNIETSENYYPSIVSTHTFDQRVRTVRAAKNAGLEVCSGGIIGMGETWGDRMEMAILLRELDVDSVPLNFLVPVKGTPLAGADGVTTEEALRTIAMFRSVLPGVPIKIVADRESLFSGNELSMYMAGANGMMVGDYLTVAGRSIDEDKDLIREVMGLWKGE